MPASKKTAAKKSPAKKAATEEAAEDDLGDELGEDVLKLAYDQLARRFDERHGGFGDSRV